MWSISSMKSQQVCNLRGCHMYSGDSATCLMSVCGDSVGVVIHTCVMSGCGDYGGMATRIPL